MAILVGVGGFFLTGELHWEGSANKGANPSSLKGVLFLICFSRSRKSGQPRYQIILKFAAPACFLAKGIYERTLCRRHLQLL